MRVVIGVLAFESLREGDVAVSSLFLKDDTGKALRSMRPACVDTFIDGILNDFPRGLLLELTAVCSGANRGTCVSYCCGIG